MKLGSKSPSGPPHLVHTVNCSTLSVLPARCWDEICSGINLNIRCCGQLGSWSRQCSMKQVQHGLLLWQAWTKVDPCMKSLFSQLVQGWCLNALAFRPNWFWDQRYGVVEDFLQHRPKFQKGSTMESCSVSCPRKTELLFPLLVSANNRQKNTSRKETTPPMWYLLWTAEAHCHPQAMQIPGATEQFSQP